MNRRLRHLPLLAALFVACAEPAARTEVIVRVVAEPALAADAVQLAVRVYASDENGLVPDGSGVVVLPGAPVHEEVVGSAGANVAFPLRLALVPEGGDATRRYLIEVEARDGSGMPLARARMISGYRRGRTLEWVLTLEDACRDVLACTTGRTCHEGTCVSAAVPVSTLYDYGQTSTGDAGTDASSPDDAGVDTGVDAGADAGMSPAIELLHYVKTSANAAQSYAGSAVAVSGDLIAIGMPGDGQNGTGVDPTIGAGTVPSSGAVVVFHRDPTSGAWSEEALIKAECNVTDYRFGASVALSGDLLAVGVPGDDSVNSGTSASCGTAVTIANSGAVYLYRRSAGGVWTLEEFVKAPRVQLDDRFGQHIALSGTHLVVGVPDDDSGFREGENGGADPWYTDGTTDVRQIASGSAFVYAFDGTTWDVEAHLKAHTVEAGDRFGASVALEGTRLVVGATGEDGSGRSVTNGATFPSNNGRPESGAAYVFEYGGGAFNQTAFLKGSRLGTADGFGASVALAGDRIAVAAPGDDAAGVGIDPPITAGGSNGGAVYLFAYATGWSETNFLKPTDVSQVDNHLELSFASGLLAVAYPLEDGTNGGIGATSNAASNPATTNAGAVFVYAFGPSGPLAPTYLKAPMPRAADEFGAAIAVSSSGFVLVGAPLEDGSGTSLDAPWDTASLGAGAAFLYRLAP